MSTTTTVPVLRTWQMVSRSSTHAEYHPSGDSYSIAIAGEVSAAASNRPFLAARSFRVSARPVGGKIAAAADAANEGGCVR